MRISGKTRVNAHCEAFWKQIFNPSALLEAVPGCNKVEQVAPNHYQANLTIRLPALAGNYEILIRILESEEPHFCRLEGSGQGSSGGVQGMGTISLLAQGERTQIDYDSEISISGPLAGMHPRFIEGVAQTLIRDWLSRLAEQARRSEINNRLQ